MFLFYWYQILKKTFRAAKVGGVEERRAKNLFVIPLKTVFSDLPEDNTRCANLTTALAATRRVVFFAVPALTVITMVSSGSGTGTEKWTAPPGREISAEYKIFFSSFSACPVATVIIWYLLIVSVFCIQEYIPRY